MVEALDLIDKSINDETVVCKFAITLNGVSTLMGGTSAQLVDARLGDDKSSIRAPEVCDSGSFGVQAPKHSLIIRVAGAPLTPSTSLWLGHM